MNKLIVVGLLFLYSSACKDVKKNKVDATTTSDTASVVTSGASKAADHVEEDYKNVIIEDPKIISDGEHSQFYKSGKLKAKGSYKEGKRDGHWTVFYESGVLWSEAVYKDGKKNGPSIVYYPSGVKRYEGTYENDQRVGSWRFYDKEGRLLKEERK